MTHKLTALTSVFFSRQLAQILPTEQNFLLQFRLESKISSVGFMKVRPQGAEEPVRLLCYVKPYMSTHMKAARLHEGYCRTVFCYAHTASRACDVVVLRYPLCKSIKSELHCKLLYAGLTQGKATEHLCALCFVITPQKTQIWGTEEFRRHWGLPWTMRGETRSASTHSTSCCILRCCHIVLLADMESLWRSSRGISGEEAATGERCGVTPLHMNKYRPSTQMLVIGTVQGEGLGALVPPVHPPCERCGVTPSTHEQV